MNIEQTIIANLRQLPPDKQQEVLDFTEFLNHKKATTSLPTTDPNLTPQERTEKWLKFIETLPKNSPSLPDEALHRDSMYD